MLATLGLAAGCSSNTSSEFDGWQRPSGPDAQSVSGVLAQFDVDSVLRPGIESVLACPNNDDCGAIDDGVVSVARLMHDGLRPYAQTDGQVGGWTREVISVSEDFVGRSQSYLAHGCTGNGNETVCDAQITEIQKPAKRLKVLFDQWYGP